MKAKELMTASVVSCGPDTNLAAVTELMWKHDCGFVPITNERGEVLGVVTDRDICIALGTRNVMASGLRARDVMSRQVVGCAPEDDELSVLHTMQEHRIRRLPVQGIGGVLLGILSLNDLARAAVRLPEGHVLRRTFIETFARICAPRHRHVAAA